MLFLAFILLLLSSFPISLAGAIKQRQAQPSFWCGPASTDTNSCPSVFCQCSSYSYHTVHPFQAPITLSGACAVHAAVTSTVTVPGLYATSDGACSYTAASQASSISTPCAQTSATTNSSATSVTPSTTPPPLSSTKPMTCSLVATSHCFCDGKLLTTVGPGGPCGPASLSVTASDNCVTVSISAYKQNKQNHLNGCICLDHWGSLESSEIKTASSDWTSHSGVHVLQPQEDCYPGRAEIYPYCRPQSFENNTISCDCQAWPEDNSFEPYQVKNPCLKAPYTTSVPATCIILPHNLDSDAFLRGPCLCHGGGITTTIYSTPCPASLPSTSSIDVVTVTGTCTSTSALSNGSPVESCTCSAASGTVTFTTHYSQCATGPYTAEVIDA